MKKGMLGALLGIFAYQNPLTPTRAPREQTTPERKPRQLDIAERNRRKGLKQFEVDGKLIWALNMKNAIRKADKL